MAGYTIDEVFRFRARIDASFPYLYELCEAVKKGECSCATIFTRVEQWFSDNIPPHIREKGYHPDAPAHNDYICVMNHGGYPGSDFFWWTSENGKLALSLYDLMRRYKSYVLHQQDEKDKAIAEEKRVAAEKKRAAEEEKKEAEYQEYLRLMVLRRKEEAIEAEVQRRLRKIAFDAEVERRVQARLAAAAAANHLTPSGGAGVSFPNVVELADDCSESEEE